MSVPDFQAMMLPFLQMFKDGKEHTLAEMKKSLVVHFNLSKDDLSELLPSGRQSKFENRIGWARTYLKKAELIKTVTRATFCITERGREVLENNPTEITSKFLERFTEFKAFQNNSKVTNETILNDEMPEQTPEESLEFNYQKLRSGLSQELLDTIKSCSPKFFENLVVDLLVAMGYGGSRKDAGQAVGQSGDGGVDGIIKEDKLGLDVVYLQAKRWENSVGRPIIQSFAGSLEGFKARKGVFITTSHFTQDARDYVTKIEKKIVLIDGDELTRLMIDFNVGVTEVASYTVKRVDMDYFVEE